MNLRLAALRLCTVPALLLSSLLSSPLAPAQAPAPRIRGPIEAAPAITLEGSLNPHTRLAEDLGPLSSDTPISGVTLVFKRSPAQEADLQQLLAEQTSPSSPLYQHWLTPQDFATRFGIADADLAATETWLQSHGLIVDRVSPGRDRIVFSGTAAQIQGAFGTQLRRYLWQDQIHFAPASEISLPPALAPLTAAVLHLSDFRPQPSVKALRPDYTTRSTQTHLLGPADIKGMYNMWPIQSQGTGQAIAVVGQSFVQTGYGSSVYNFQTYVAASHPSITPVIVPGSGVEAIFPGDVGESEIDLEYSSAIAPAANFFFVYTGSSGNYDVMDALAYAIAEDIAPVISVSYSICEPLASAADLQQYNALFQQAAAQGQTIVVASGDDGSTACSPFGTQSGLTTAQQQELAVAFPASSPYVTAVGGTQMAPGTFSAGVSQYWDSATATNDAVDSLISYVPEVVWNEDSPTLGILSSGGGASSIFPRPAWQSGVPGIPSGAFRLVPDIALQASVFNPGFLICSDDPYLVGPLTDCSSSVQATNGTYVTSGGTSFGAPIFAGFLADLATLKYSTGFGNINPLLYSLAAQPAIYASAFHDITSGTTACSAGDGNCGAPGESAYAATPGYDLATGLGSLDFANLAAQWPSAASTGKVPTYLYLSGQPVSASPGAASTVNISLNISNGTCGFCTPPAPSGNLSVTLDGAAATPLPLRPVGLGAAATYNFVAPAATGSHVVVIRYPGDDQHLASSTAFSVLTGSVFPTGGFALSANNLSLASGGSGSTPVTITPSGGYTGALTWSSSYTGATSATICYFIDSPPINGATTATLHLGVGAACSSPSALKVPSTVQRASAPHLPPPWSRKLPAGALLAVLLFALPPSRRRGPLPLLSFLSLAVLSIALSGCGGASSNAGGGGGGGNPQPQVYTLTLTGKDSVNSAINASTSFTLTVE